jgi:NAD(P)-dependent dehydrogenase (short-subunit alcohol dehydrogenase family)
LTGPSGSGEGAGVDEQPGGTVGALEGRVAIITGAGRGLGREHALLFAAEGAKVVVNDLGGAPDGGGSDATAAEEVVAEITAAGGEAVANHDDVADWEGGHRLVQSAVDAFGRLDVLVNNAGILRDRALVNMTEAEWDSVITVHLKGHFVPTRAAAVHWRERAKAGDEVRASVIHTSSTSGLLGNPGQSNYGAAKAGIGAFSAICAQELGRYGVRSNCIAPAARTRLTEATPGLGEVVAAPPEGFDVWDPANVAPVVAYLASEACDLTGKTFFVQGGTVRIMEPWQMGDRIERPERWTVADLAEALPGIAG